MPAGYRSPHLLVGLARFPAVYLGISHGAHLIPIA